MPNLPIALQLYSLREESKDSFDQVLQDVAAAGYQGVEPFNLFDFSPREFAQRTAQLGLEISSSHYPWANRTEVNTTVEVLGELGLNRAVGGFGPDDFANRDAIQRTVETTAKLSADLASQGISLALHNHWWEYELIDGEPAYYLLQEALLPNSAEQPTGPQLCFELDTYWAANFGARNPAAELARVAQHTPLLHIKDGPLVRGEPNVVLGNGKIDIPSVLRAADRNTLEWLVIEFDSCASDMMGAVTKSYQYLAPRTGRSDPA